jgi:hypothetical protein
MGEPEGPRGLVALCLRVRRSLRESVAKPRSPFPLWQIQRDQWPLRGIMGNNHPNLYHLQVAFWRVDADTTLATRPFKCLRRTDPDRLFEASLRWHPESRRPQYSGEARILRHSSI